MFSTARDNSFTLNAVSFLRQSSKIAISWNQSGYPTGGINTYQFAIAFSFPEPSLLTLTAESTPSTGSDLNNWSKLSTNPSTYLATLEVLEENNLPTQMYLRKESFGANYGNSYGLVNSSSNNQLDWSLDGQAINVIYIGINLPVILLPDRVEPKWLYSSTMAIWEGPTLPPPISIPLLPHNSRESANWKHCRRVQLHRSRCKCPTYSLWMEIIQPIIPFST